MTNDLWTSSSSFEKKKLGIVSVLFQIPKCELEWFQFQFSEPVLVQIGLVLNQFWFASDIGSGSTKLE